MINVDGYTTIQEIKKTRKTEKIAMVFYLPKTNPADIEND